MTQKNNSKLKTQNSKLEFTPPHPLKTAVLFLVFNRLDTTKQVFEAIRTAKPPRLYIAADGARDSREGEAEKVKAVRDYVLSSIDWECEVKTLFREQNLGCKMAVSSAITWFFDNEEMGIILEDDCLPSQSFFWFCEDLLQRYKDDRNVFLISGDGRATDKIHIDSSYDFIKYPMIWGWASWRRTWQNYDVLMTDWNKEKENLIASVSDHKGTQRSWKNSFEQVYNGKINTWDYQFAYLVLKNQASCIIPSINLISNIGFGMDATHTIDENDSNANIQKFEMTFPLRHPSSIKMNENLNTYYDLNEFFQQNIFIRGIKKLSRILRGINIYQ